MWEYLYECVCECECECESGCVCVARECVSVIECVNAHDDDAAVIVRFSNSDHQVQNAVFDEVMMTKTSNADF